MQVLTDMYMHRDSLCRMARPTWKQATGWQRWGTHITCTGTGMHGKAWSTHCALHSINTVHQSMLDVSIALRIKA